MTATVLVAATNAADISSTGTIADGLSETFYAFGLQGGERILLEAPDNSGVYRQVRYLDGAGKMREAALEPGRTILKVNGPIDWRINKPVTVASVEVGRYT